MRSLDELLVHLVVRTRRVGDVETTLFIKVSLDGPRNEIGAGHEFDFKAIRQPEVVRADFEIRCVNQTAKRERQDTRELAHRTLFNSAGADWQRDLCKVSIN